MESIHTILVAVVLPALATSALALACKILASKQVADLMASLASRAAAETEHFVELANNTHSAGLQIAVQAAMSYAETHSDEVLKQFDSKADFVIHSVLSNPKFPEETTTAEEIKNCIEQMYLAYFVNLRLPAKAPAPAPAPAPADVSGGGPGKDGH